MKVSYNIKLGLLVGMSIFIAAFFIVIIYVIIKLYFNRKDKMERDKRGSFKKLNEVIKHKPVHPYFGDQKEYIYHDGSLKSLETKSSSSSPVTGGTEDLCKLRVGKFEFTPTYYHDRSRLQIVIRRVTCYPVYQNLQNIVYLYVVACLLPDRKEFFESDLQQIHEDNMVDEMCEFEVQYSEIENRTLLFEIHVCDRYSKHQIIDELRYTLIKSNEAGKNKSIEKLDFEEHDRTSKENSRRKGSSVFPEFLVSLCYMPTSGRLTFVALKGKSIEFDATRVKGMYLQVSLIQVSRTVKTVVTNTIKRTSSPVFNEAFVFHVPLERVQDSYINISIITKLEMNGGKIIGKLTIGSQSEANLGRKHWEAMLLSPRRPIAQWHVVNEIY